MENNNIDEDTLKKLNNMTPDELKKIQAIIKEAVNEIEATKEGKWVKYEQGSNSHELWLSLQEYHTGWGIATAEDTARSQLANGDFYVYYSLDENGNAKVPRILIGMNRINGMNEIYEISGIADDQNIEPEMLPILDKKLNEDDESDKQKLNEYLKRVHDLELLTLIDKKTSYGQKLSVDEIRFLYEADDKITGFGRKQDPRINEIKQKRNKIYDYKLMLKYIKNFNRHLDLSFFTNAEGLDLSGANIVGNLDLSGLTSPEGLKLSGVNIGLDLNLEGLTTAEGLDLSGANIVANLNLRGLKNANGLDLSGTNIGWKLDLSGLTTAEGLDLSGANIGKYLDLSGLKSAKGLKLPKNIKGSLNLGGLTSAEGLDLSGVNIDHALYLENLTTAKGLNLSGVNIGIGFKLNLEGLTNAEGLMLPYNFELDNLICNDDIKEEIRNNHDKYFAKPPVEEELNEVAAQKFNDETEALVINGNGDKKVAYVKKYDGTIEKIPYSKSMDKFIGEQKAAKERGKFSRFFEISSDPEVARGQVEALEEIINRNNNLDSADNSKQSDGNVADESMNVHRTR